MVKSKRDRADAMEAMEEYSQNFASKDVSWISSALNEQEKEKTRHTTKAWNLVGRPLKKTVGTGLPSMYSNGIIKRTVVIVKEATKINSNTRVWIGWMEHNFELSLRFGRKTDAISA
ncbi:hypothetical protein LOK49_LG06G01057 [Camellia lanceoleosa]|uniref:Uncharacterized protein n=1 Tax=Camellia lanceoleosa TaxID=1840588 RepID=A0ACC0H935_9ERIC|nr:hypothetical protein LOK49_LG06G01057 [Camellia lanceoleosa]